MTTALPVDLSRRSVLPLLAAAGLALTSAAMAQQPPGDEVYRPLVGQEGKDVIWVPTPDVVVMRMLQMAEVKPDDLVVDLGSGDGKIAIAAARSFGATARGLEYNPDLVSLSQRIARQAGVADKVSFEHADIFVTDFSKATVVTMYLLPQLNLKLRPQLFALAPGTRVVSHSFSMGEWLPDEKARLNNADVFLWRVPANASGSWQLVAGAVNGRLNLTQKFQVLSGEALFGDLRTSVVQPVLSGAGLNFQLREPGGQLARYEGRVTGNRIVGLVHRAGQAPLPFEAVRDVDPVPLLLQQHDDTAAAAPQRVAHAQRHIERRRAGAMSPR
ncbi:SAM-dependent methyltransferase [Pseudorhodoferax sp.]|uniref:SAM-dependent methyltransferase n=1 Tax=Pseudorhodoferax sp. TaxID=1993553 RepID=UPI002DD64BC3|nr:methyltransferase domain-containing protein [Pseudorhodoferax sp.]